MELPATLTPTHPCRDSHTVTFIGHSVPGGKCHHLPSPSFRVKSSTSQSEGDSVPSSQTECPHALLSSLFIMLPCRSCRRESSFPPLKSTLLLCLRTKHCKMSGAFKLHFAHGLGATRAPLFSYIIFPLTHITSVQKGFGTALQ